jgi:putative nucleotidyltransferase with HDIG domain
VNFDGAVVEVFGVVALKVVIVGTTEKISAAAGDTPLESWLGAIEHYHDYTFMHCMFVCFTIVAFAQAIGIKNGDLSHLTLGALLHDIGKSRVPIAILDKPAKLDADEWQIMQQHPEFSR